MERQAPSLVNAEMKSFRWVGVGFIAAWCLFSIYRILSAPLLGNWSGDESWYTNTAVEVCKGRALYSDIRFTQMPLFPWVYGAFLSFLPHAIEWPRLLSLAFTTVGLIALWLILLDRYGLWPAIAALATVAAAAFSLQGISVFTQPLTFALGCWIIWSIHKLEKQPAPRLAILCGALCGLVVATRLSLLPVLLLAPAFIWLFHRQKKLISLWAIGAAFPLLLPLYYLATAPDQFLFGIYRFHALLGEGASVGIRYTDFMIGWATEAPIWAAVFVTALISMVVMARQGDTPSFEWFVLSLFTVITALHASRAVSYPVHQAAIAWGPILMTGWILKELSRTKNVFPRMVQAVTVAAVFIVGISGIRNGIAATGHPHPMNEALAVISKRGSCKLLSFDPGFSYYTDAKLLPGYEMGIFSMVPESLPDDRQNYFRGIGQAKFLSDLENEADVIAISYWNLNLIPIATRAKAIDIINQKYTLTYAKQGYGQWGDGDTIYIGVRKPNSEQPNRIAYASWSVTSKSLINSIY